MPSSSIGRLAPAAPTTPARRQSGRALRWVLALVGTLAALVIVALIVLTHWDWNRHRPWVNAKVSEATGRHFAIEGDLSVDWHWPQPLETGWRRWVPGVTVQAQQLVMDNPDGFTFAEEPAKGDKTLPALPRKPQPMTEQQVAAAEATSKKLKAAARAEPASAPATVASSASAAAPRASEPATAQAAQAQASDAARALALEKSNAPTAQAPERGPQTMGTLASASATLRLWPLLARKVVLDTVVLTSPDIALGRKADGTNNWTFKQRDDAKDDPEKSDNPWDLSVGQLIIRGGWLGYVDGTKDLALRARVDTIDPDAAPAASGPGASPYGVRMALQGRYGKARIQATAQGGSVLSLREQVVNYPLQFKARAGSVQAEAEGILANPAALSGLDFQVALQAASMADLFDLTGIVLPNTPPFQTRGHLIGNLAPERATWEYRDFRGTVGESDLQGSLTYTSAQPRPQLKGTMKSRQLRLADLGPVVGAPTGDGAQEKGTSKRAGKVLPDAAFATDRWNAMDVDLSFAGERIVRPDSLPIENLSVHAKLQNAELTLEPLRFGVAKGKIDSRVVLDARDGPLKTQLRGSVEGLQLSALFPKVELMEKSFGRLDGAVALSATGNSVARMLGSSSGEARLYIRDGTFSKQMLDLAALNVGSVVVSRLFGENEEVKLRCAVADFAVRDGVAETRSVQLSTDEALVEAVGTVDLRNEQMNLRIKPESLKWKFLSLRTPLYVRGTFSDPKVGLEAGPLLLRAGAAVAAAAVAPVALALVPITVPAAEDDSRCNELLARSRQAVKAGKAGAAAPAPQNQPQR